MGLTTGLQALCYLSNLRLYGSNPTLTANKTKVMTLKEATATLHSKAEKMEFNQRMFKGELSPLEYGNYLTQQLVIFSEIERRVVLPHDNLKRSEVIRQDINELGVYTFKINKATNDYVVYLGDLNQNSLNAHIYLNYLAIMFGGQMMKSKVPGSGKMYEFEGDMRELIGSVRAIQNDEMADEVNKGFQYIINILDELQKNAG
jgi:heme oxygenase